MSTSALCRAVVLAMSVSFATTACRTGREGVTRGSAPTPVAPRTADKHRLLAVGHMLVCMTGYGRDILCSSHPGGGLAGWDRNDGGRLAPVPQLEGTVQLAIAMGATCARMGDGTVRCWGQDAGGILGNGRPLPTTPPNGGGDDCPMVANTNMAEPSYGPGPLPSLGNTLHVPPPPPFTPNGYDVYPHVDEPTPVVDIHDAVELVAGTGGFCARLASGRVSCWGGGIGCQRATGWAVDASMPIPLEGLPPIRALASFDVLVAEDGTLHHWIPADVTGPEQYPKFSSKVIAAPRNAEQIVWSHRSGYARMPDGTVACLGAGNDESCGRATNLPDDTSPPLVGALTHVIDLTMGRQHACALHEDGTATCWGANYRGQLGNGVISDWSVPKPVVGLNEIVQMAASELTTCAVRQDGSLWCWGLLPDGGPPSPVPRLWSMPPSPPK